MTSDPLQNARRPSTTQQQVKIAIVACWAMAALGLALAIFGVYFVGLGLASASWPSTEGQVASSRVTWSTSSSDPGVAKRRSYFVEVTYRYVVDEEVYTSSRYSLGWGSRATEERSERAEAVKDRQPYLPGKTVEVFYDPDEPGSAVLRPGASGSTFIPLGMGVALAFSGLALVVAVRRRSPRS